jgi:hypothetical protein
MATPSQPSQGVLVPSHLIFHSELPAPVLVTWIQLRCLAWEGRTTPPMKIPEFAAFLGIHPSRFYKHLCHLRDISALSWRSAGHEKIIISFLEEQTSKDENLANMHHPIGSSNLYPADQVKPAPASYFPFRILGYLSYDDDEMDPLYIDESIEAGSGTRDDQALDFSKLVTSQPVEGAFTTK